MGASGSPIEPRACAYCGETFTPKRRRTAKCCSSRCCEAFRATGASRPHYLCVECGAPFTPGRRDQRLCSATCRNRRSKRNYKATERGRQVLLAGRRRYWAKHADELRVARGAPGPNGRRSRRNGIGNRDGWVCGICSNPVDPALRYPDRMSPSIDHVVPVALGGSSAESNLQIAHWICNIEKSTGTLARGEQLQLVG